jgi:hypothetical protein
MQNLHMYLVSLHILCTPHILHCLVGYFWPVPPATILSSMCLLKSPEHKPGNPLGHLVVHCFSGHCSVSDLGSAGLWTSDMQHIPNARQDGPVLFFVCVLNILYTKNVLKIA